MTGVAFARLLVPYNGTPMTFLTETHSGDAAFDIVYSLACEEPSNAESIV
jgi:hypothetical protein